MKKILALFVSTILTITLAIGSTVSYVASEYIAPDSYAGPVALTLSNSESGEGSANVISLTDDKVYWEPGYTALVVLKVQNANDQTEAFNYQLSFQTDDVTPLADLAEVIDVYWFPGANLSDALQRQDIIEGNRIGNLSQLLNVITVCETIPADQASPYYISLVFRMREEAGNEYQGQTIPEFKVTISANS